MSEAHSEGTPTVEAAPDVIAHSDAPTTSHEHVETEGGQSSAAMAPGTIGIPIAQAGATGSASTVNVSSSSSSPSSHALAPPETVAEPLPAEVDEIEIWWNLKMSWSGKVYDIRIGSNDLWVEQRGKAYELMAKGI